MKLLPIAFVLAAVGLGAGGYMLTGNPGLPSAPAPRIDPDSRLTPEAEKASTTLLENYGDVRDWLTASDAFIRAGRTETAAYILDQATHRIPGNVDLWVQLGIALVAHADGEVVPAARLAFDRASRIEPDHPAPIYFLGLAWLQAGEPAKALAVWEPLDAADTQDAPWRPMLERLMRGARQMIALGVTGTTPEDAGTSEGPAPVEPAD